jgi:hypothetical protein
MAEYELKVKVTTKDADGAELEATDQEQLFASVKMALMNLHKVEDVTHTGKSAFTKKS